MQQYLESFSLPTEQDEVDFILDYSGKHYMSCYSDNIYPFKVFGDRGMPTLSFEPITIFYGGNGSGKSTLLNVIGEKLELRRLAPFNHTPYFEDYLRRCSCRLTYGKQVPKGSKIITSDAVFDFLLDVRAMNDGVDGRREELFSEYAKQKDPNAHMQLSSLDEYETFKQFRDAKRSTKSDYTRRRLPENLAGKSNGESAYAYFTHHIEDGALYLLDEPENSLSAALQESLAGYLLDSARFYRCQFVISTHSPFLLAMKGAKIYDLDARPVSEARWTDLPAVRVWYDFFERHKDAF